MDTLRGNLSGYGSPEDDGTNYDRGEEENYRELPPSAIGQDERRMQVRAYNFWASLLTDRNLPSIEDLDPENLPDFGPNSVLMDFSCGIDDPAIVFLGDKLAAECGSTGPISRLSDVPSRSLLSRITDHHLQIIANQAPIGFEAEFVNQRGAPIMYRGILLPFSSDDDTIDFIFGVINWKEIADQQTTDDLLLEIDLALKGAPDPARIAAPHVGWADGPADIAAEPANDSAGDADDGDDDAWPVIVPLPEAGAPETDTDAELPAPIFGRRRRGLIASVAEDDDWTQVPPPETASEAEPPAGPVPVPEPYEHPVDQLDVPTVPARYLSDEEAFDLGAYELPAEEPATAEIAAAADVDALDLSAFAELDETAPDVFGETAPAAESAAVMDLADWLASARELADAAQQSEHRSHQSLYAAIGRAYDFSIAASADPAGFAELVADADLTMQDRAPMTPLVKLVFGANYDKTRLTEYAAVLSYASRLDLACGGLESYLLQAAGGLKAVVQTERQLRRGERGVPVAETRSPRERLARKLRQLDHRPLGAVEPQGSEFALLVARRLPTGEVVLLGEVTDDTSLLEKAARKLLN